jgi:TIR domain
MTHVFISYVRQNRDLVDRLAKELKDSGVTVWLDREDIEPGTRWREAIRKAIKNGKFFLACFSTEYTARDKTHMNEEITLAIDELRIRPTERAWFIPIILNDTEIPDRPISSVETLADIQAVRLFEDWEAGIRRILRAITTDNPIVARVYYLSRPSRNQTG